MATNEPINEQALTKIRELLADDGRQWDDYSPQDLYRVGWSAELLLAEVDRLRAREQALAAENAAMRPIVEVLATGGVIATGSVNTRITGSVLYSVFTDMSALYEQARAFITAHPTAAGEAESEGE